jgi:hypothetical protein
MFTRCFKVCQWRGVECDWEGDGQGRVISLRLSNSGSSLGISGAFPETITVLRQLKILELDGNRFRGSLPASWSVLSSLEVLALSSNEASGDRLNR